MTEQKLGRFGWHPDPAIDFEVEVTDLEAEMTNRRIGFQPAPRDVLLSRMERALDFRVGGVPSCVSAKGVLRQLHSELTKAA